MPVVADKAVSNLLAGTKHCKFRCHKSSTNDKTSRIFSDGYCRSVNRATAAIIFTCFIFSVRKCIGREEKTLDPYFVDEIPWSCGFENKTEGLNADAVAARVKTSPSERIFFKPPMPASQCPARRVPGPWPDPPAQGASPGPRPQPLDSHGGPCHGPCPGLLATSLFPDRATAMGLELTCITVGVLCGDLNLKCRVSSSS